MPEDQNIPKQPPEEVASTDPNIQDSLISLSETHPPNMEVHHHPNLHHNKKQFREYILEFIMIFLAVTMGFYAENLREGLSESKKAKELAASLINNLEQDSAQSSRTSEAKKWREGKLDSLVLIASKKMLPGDNKQLYYFANFLFQDFPYHTEDAVFQQIKNSGGLRYFKNPKIQTEIARYYTYTQWMESDVNDIQSRNQMNLESFRITSRIFKAKEFGAQMKDSMEGYTEEIHRLAFDPVLLSNDSLLYNQLASIAVFEIQRSRAFRGIGTLLKQQREKIIEDLKFEYGLGSGD